MHLNLVFDPTPYGFKLPSKAPSFDVLIHTPVSKIGEIRASVQPYPLWDIEFELEWARGGEQMPGTVYNYLLGFFLQCGGPFSDFLYDDSYDDSVTAAFFGLGDGTTTQFQLIRPIGAGSDIVQNLNGTPTLYSNGTVISGSAYTLSTTGIVTFTTAPASGVVLTWTGNYYYRVRFLNPEVKFSQFAKQIWEAKSLPLRSVILGSVLS